MVAFWLLLCVLLSLLHGFGLLVCWFGGVDGCALLLWFVVSGGLVGRLRWPVYLLTWCLQVWLFVSLLSWVLLWV